MDPIFDSFPEIETKHLLLRELMPEDAQALFTIFADEEVTRYYDLDTLTELAEARALIDFFAESFEVERMIRWGITRKEDDLIIGTCGYVTLRRFRAEIGYDLRRDCWRQGIMFEALDAIVDFGFAELALNRIEALVMQDNIASSRLLHKLGFQEEGTLREHDFFKGQFHDMRSFSILKREFYTEEET